jgi:hypothetical protein
MYACIPDIDGGFFEGVCTFSDQACISSDPPPPCHSWIASCLYCLLLSGFLPLTAVNVYSLLQYLVLDNKPQGGGNRPSSAPTGAGHARFWIWTS